MSNFLNSIAHLNNSDLNSLDNIFLVDIQEYNDPSPDNPSYDNMVFYKRGLRDITEHDLCHCLVYGIENNFDRLKMKNFGFSSGLDNVVSPVENAIEEWKTITINATINPYVNKSMQNGIYNLIPEGIIEQAYPSTKTQYHKILRSKDPSWKYERHQEFQSKMYDFTKAIDKFTGYSLDDVKSAVIKLREHFS